jgi:hypothetical protein
LGADPGRAGRQAQLARRVRYFFFSSGKALEKAGAAFLDVLDSYSLADLVKPRTPLRGLLEIEADGSRKAGRGSGPRARL